MEAFKEELSYSSTQDRLNGKQSESWETYQEVNNK